MFCNVLIYGRAVLVAAVAVVGPQLLQPTELLVKRSPLNVYVICRFYLKARKQNSHAGSDVACDKIQETT